MTPLLASYGLPMDISAHGYQIDRLINWVHVFMLLLFFGWGAFFVYCLTRFRASTGCTADYQLIKAKPSKYLEIAVVVFEIFLLFGLSQPVWAKYKSSPPPEANPFRVRIVAQQFAWNIHYPGPDGEFGRTRPELVDETRNPIGLDRESPGGEDDVVELNVLRLPKGRSIQFELSSKDVIHSFSIPLLRIKQDTVPGMEIPIWATATQTTEWVQEQQVRTLVLEPPGAENSRFNRRFKNMVLMADAAGGGKTFAKGTLLNDAVVQAMVDAGVVEVQIAPRAPVEIQCAQLCGLGHYRMRGEVIILEPAAFDEWYGSAGEEEFFEE